MIGSPRAHRFLSEQRGVALILTLALIVIIATFAAAITSKARAALVQANNYKASAQAFALAEAGLHRALYEIKFDPASGHAACAGSTINAQDMKYETWYYGTPEDALRTSTHASFFHQYMITTGTQPNVSEEMSRRQRIKLKIVDAASKININAPDTAGLERLLGNLFAVCDTSIASSTAHTIITNRPAITRDATTGQISGGYPALFAIKHFFTETQYAAVRPYLTTRSFVDVKLVKETNDQISHGIRRCVIVDPATEARAPININTAPLPVLRAVLRGLAGMSNATADTLADRIRTRTNDTAANSLVAGPFETWSEFQNFLAAQSGLSFDADVLFAMLNPNRPKGGASATPYTTDFCFSSEGYFEIESLGDVINAASLTFGAQTLSMKAKIFDVFRVSTRDDFVGSFTNALITNTDHDGDGLCNIMDKDLDSSTVENNISFNTTDPYQSLLSKYGNPAKPGFLNISWYDSTPVNPHQDTSNGLSNNYACIPGAIKLGFWDDFDDDRTSSSRIWRPDNRPYGHPLNQSTYFFSLSSGTPHDIYFSGTEAADQDYELWQDYYAQDPLAELPAPYAEIGPDDNPYFDLFLRYRPQLHNNIDDNNSLINTCAFWEGSMYLRTSVTEHPRAYDAINDGNIPAIDADKPAGRDYRDVGLVGFRVYDDWTQYATPVSLYALCTTGNFYNDESLYHPFDMDGSNDIDWGLSVPIRNVTAIFPPAEPVVNALTEPFAYANPSQPWTLPNAPNLPDRINAVFGTVAPWIIDRTDVPRLTSIQMDPSITPFGVRNKIYRTILHGSNASLQVASAGLSSGFHELFQAPTPHNRGSIMFIGKASHPAWDDVRIIGEQGEYTTAAFTPVSSLGSTNALCLWGTCAWTQTMRSGPNSSPSLSLSFIFPQSDTPGMATTYGLLVPYSNAGIGGAIRTSSTIARYPYRHMRIHMNMTCDIDQVSNEMPDVPVLEDISVTYLKETETYEFSQR